MKYLKKLKLFSPKKALMLTTVFSTLTLNFLYVQASDRNEDYDNQLFVTHTSSQNSPYLSDFEKIPNELVYDISFRQSNYNISTICKIMELNKNFLNLIKEASLDKRYLRPILTVYKFDPDNEKHLNNLPSYISGFSFRNFIHEIHNIPSHFFPDLKKQMFPLLS